MKPKTFHTDYPLPGQKYDGTWRPVNVLSYDGNKYVFVTGNGRLKGQEIKLGYIHFSPNGPSVSFRYANRHFFVEEKNYYDILLSEFLLQKENNE